MNEVSFFSALLGGILTFLAPCTLPLIPGYLAFIGGGSTVSATGGAPRFRPSVMANATFFVLGFSVVFMCFGMASGAVGKFLILNKTAIAQAGGVFILYFGAAMLGWVPAPRWTWSTVMRWKGALSPGSRSGAFLLGFLFALGWSPCLGPILGAILLIAATKGTILSGGLLLGVYALGLALPLLLVAFVYGTAFTYVKAFEPYLRYVTFLGGALLMVIGLLMIIGQYGLLNAWAGEFIDGKLFDILLTYT